MLKRYSVAFVGASIVTIVLVLGMSKIAELFEREDSQVYMRVMDFIPGSGARRLPDKRMPEAQPERAAVDAGDIAQDAPLTIAPAAEFGSDEPIDLRLDLDPLPPD